MELKDLIGLHILGGVDIVETPHRPLNLRGIRFTLDGANYLASERSHPGGGVTMDLIQTTTPPAKTCEVPVFCIHHAVFGEFLLKSDVLSVYDARTARRILLMGTEEIELDPECVLAYTPEGCAPDGSTGGILPLELDCLLRWIPTLSDDELHTLYEHVKAELNEK